MIAITDDFTKHITHTKSSSNQAIITMLETCHAIIDMGHRTSPIDISFQGLLISGCWSGKNVGQKQKLCYQPLYNYSHLHARHRYCCNQYKIRNLLQKNENTEKICLTSRTEYLRIRKFGAYVSLAMLIFLP